MYIPMGTGTSDKRQDLTNNNAVISFFSCNCPLNAVPRLALKKSLSPLLKFICVHLTMQRLAMKFDPPPLLRPPRYTVKFVWPDGGRINGVPGAVFGVYSAGY